MYLSLAQIAESFGVQEQVVEGWIRNEGLPHTPDRGRLLFDRAQVAHWAAERGMAAKAGFLAPVTPAFATGCRLEPLLRAGGIWRDVAPEEVLAIFERVLANLPGASPTILQLMSTRLRLPDGINWAPLGGGFALPHLSTRIALGRDSGAIALVLLRSPLVLAEPSQDGVPLTRLVFFVAPSPRAHLDLLGRFSRILRPGSFRDLLLRGGDDEEIFRTVAAIDAASFTAEGSDARS